MLAIMIVSLISMTSATDIIAGEPYTLNVTEQYDYYSIVGNSTLIDLDVNQEGNIITITPNKYMNNKTFTIIFFNKEKKIIYQSSGGGGGGTRTIYKDNNITEYVNREVEKIVEVEDQEEIDRLLGIANDSVKGESIWKTLFVFALSLIIFFGIIKLFNIKKE